MQKNNDNILHLLANPYYHKKKNDWRSEFN